MPPENAIDYIEFTVADVQLAKTFYTQVFGWKFEDYGPDYVSFSDGRIAGGFQTGTNSSGGPLVVLYAPNLYASEASIVSAGGKIVVPVFDFPGGRRFHFTDPLGNTLAIWSEQ
jgi:hypothetical protein